MADADRPQIYLITPPVFDAEVFPDRLKAVLDNHEIACIRLGLAARDEDALSRAADVLRDTARRVERRRGRGRLRRFRPHRAKPAGRRHQR